MNALDSFHRHEVAAARVEAEQIDTHFNSLRHQPGQTYSTALATAITTAEQSAETVSTLGEFQVYVADGTFPYQAVRNAKTWLELREACLTDMGLLNAGAFTGVELDHTTMQNAVKSGDSLHMQLFAAANVQRQAMHPYEKNSMITVFAVEQNVATRGLLNVMDSLLANSQDTEASSRGPQLSTEELDIELPFGDGRTVTYHVSRDRSPISQIYNLRTSSEQGTNPWPIDYGFVEVVNGTWTDLKHEDRAAPIGTLDLAYEIRRLRPTDMSVFSRPAFRQQIYDQPPEN